MNDTFMKTRPVLPLLVSMALPNVISMLVNSLYNIVDSVFVSRVCEQALTAVSLAFPAQNLMIGLATGTAVGVNALMGRALGAKDQERADAVAINGVFLAVVGFAICAVLALLFAGPFFRSQTQIDYIVENGTDYLLVCCCGSLGLFCEIMFERLLQGTGRSILSMYTQGLGAIVNIVLDPIFIFVLDMGVTGAAVDGAARQVIADAGYGPYFGHSFGHSVGVEIHENPNATPSNSKPLPAGAVISAEPGIYLPGKLGVRIEDVIVITEQGCQDITLAPKELLIL